MLDTYKFLQKILQQEKTVSHANSCLGISQQTSIKMFGTLAVPGSVPPLIHAQDSITAE